MLRTLPYDEINHAEWEALVRGSKTGTWFQTPEAYDFFASMPELFMPFVVAVANNSSLSEAEHSVNPSLQKLRAVCVGYVTMEKNPIKQFFTRRAIIIGGPALADDATDEEVNELLAAIRNVAQKRNDATLLHNDELMNPIYIETRNFSDYSRWKGAFEAAGFTYHPHLNIRIDTADAAAAIAKIGKHKQHRIKTSLDVGARVITEPTIHQVAEYYDLLRDFYSRHVRKPLPGWEIWETLYHHEACRYILIEHQERIIGGSVCIIWPGKAIYEWYACGRDNKERKISPASLIKYAEIQMAGELHIPLLDLMGAGNPDEPYGVRDFKAEFGGETVEYGRYICVRKPLLYKIGKFGIRLLKTKI